MQTSLQRRQRHRRNGAARRGRGGGAARKVALAIPLLLFSSFLVLGVVGFVAAVSAYAYYSKDLPDPNQAFKDLAFDSPTTIFDKTGTVQLATFGEHRREIVTYDQLPPEMIDATTAIEDKDFWTNPGFDLGGFISATIDTLTGHPRGGSTITQQLVRARLLPESAFQGSVYDRKIKEIIQSIRLTQENQGVKGKQDIITAYLNQNFYGNQSYGVEAAAQSYFGKDVKDLTLSQMALLAAIPQSPTDYDLVRNAQPGCKITVTDQADCPTADVQLVVPDSSTVVQRRNQVIELMRTRSVLSGSSHQSSDYDAAEKEPVILAPQVIPQWKAAQFVWQVREQLGALLCGVESKNACEQVDTGGYQVTTTLDWGMQQQVEKWLYIAARIPQAKTLAQSKAMLKAAGVPSSDWSWILNFRGKNINNDAGVAIDYRTGQILAYGGSAGYYLPGTKKFQPQYDVLSDGFRQMGSAVKPINYVTAIDDHAITAATVFMDVVTDFGRGFTPADADKMERGPVRARSALQFSLNIPALKLSMIQGLNHLYQRTLDFGFVYPPTVTGPVTSMAIGTLEMHAIDLTSAFGAIADGGVLMPRTTILQVKDHNGNVIYPTPDTPAVQGKQVVSPQAAYIVTDILQGNTLKSQNAYWARWTVYEKGKRRPATVKTGTTDDNKDITAFGYVAPPDDPKAPAIVVGVWMGNSDSSPAGEVTSVGSSEALWNHLMTAVTKGMPIADFKKPSGIVTATVDAFSGQAPSQYTVKTVTENFIKGTENVGKDTLHVETQIDSATGKLWQDGCDGPQVTKGFLDFSSMEPAFPAWQPFTQDWAQRAAKGSGVRGGPRHTPTVYFFDGFLVPFGRTWGGSFAPTDVCQPGGGSTCGPGGGGGQPGASPTPCPTPGPTATPGPTPTHGPKPTPTPTPAPTKPAGTAPP